MLSEWESRYLEEVIEIRHGFPFKGEYFRDEPTEYVLLTPANFAVGGGFRFDKVKYYDGPIPEEYVLNAGDLLVVMTDLSREGGLLGYPAVVPHSPGVRYLHNQRLGKILFRDGSDLDLRFLYYLLCTDDYRNEILASATGTTVKHTSPRRILAHRAAWPEPREQHAIARIFCTLDDKIELNRQTDRTLGTMMQALFKSWFVEFEPVIAKAEGRTPFAVGKHLSTLFPGSFHETDLGPLPEGWRLGAVGDLARYVNGRNFTGGASGAGRTVIRIAELNGGPGPSTVYNDVSTMPDHTAYPGDLLFAWSGSLGVYRWFRDEALINQHIFKVVCQEYPQWFVHQHLLEALPFFQAIAVDKATTMGHIKREHLFRSRVAVTPESLVVEAGEVFESLYQKVLHNERQSLALTSVRNALLPKLMAGEIRLGQSEKLVEHVV